MEAIGKEIKLRRALILGNFYDRQVRIISDSYETIIDTIIGIKQDLVLTKNGRSIQKDSIRTIYQIC